MPCTATLGAKCYTNWGTLEALTTGLVWPGPGGMRPGLKPCPGCLHEGTWVWYNVFPELFVTIIFTNCFSWKTCHLIHLLVLYWQKVRRTGSIKWMHTGTVHDADQESMSLAASVEALSVLNACVEMTKKTSLGMAPPLFSNAMKQNHYNQNLWEHACPKL